MTHNFKIWGGGRGRVDLFLLHLHLHALFQHLESTKEPHSLHSTGTNPPTIILTLHFHTIYKLHGVTAVYFLNVTMSSCSGTTTKSTKRKPRHKKPLSCMKNQGVHNLSQKFRGQQVTFTSSWNS